MTAKFSYENDNVVDFAPYKEISELIKECNDEIRKILSKTSD
jgi:hypothetical protein